MGHLVSRVDAAPGERIEGAFRAPGILAGLTGVLAAAYWAGGEAGLAGAGLVLGAVAAMPPVLRRLNPTGSRDPVTDLPDRAAATARLEALSKSGAIGGRRVAAIALGFDRIDDLRTRLGDTALAGIRRDAAQRIARFVREGDIIAVLDEATFAIVLEDLHRADLEMLLQIAARVQRELSDPFMIDCSPFQVTVSAGFCLPNQAPDASASGLLTGAERALAAARRETGGAIRAYSGEMLIQDRMNAAFSESVAAALANGEIHPWFQPQISAETGALTGVEALARWVKPSGEVLAPAEFLPALKAEGLSERLGEHMLTRSLSALSEWDAAGLDVPGVSLNLSRNDLWNPRLVDQVRWELDRYGMEPDRLTLEVRQILAGEGPENTALRNLRDLSRLGCAIDLDDFGTGAVSLADLRRLSIRRIKIDRSFIALVDRDAAQRRLITAILSMAERLELETIAVGVETSGERAMLARLGCDHVQGYAIASPMPSAAMPGWLSQRAGREAAPHPGPRGETGHMRADGGKTA